MTPSETAAAGVPHFAEPPAPSSLLSGDAGRMAATVAGGLLALYGLSRRSLPGLALAGVGTAIAVRGAKKAPAPVEIVQSMSVRASRADVYAYWRRLENLPLFMEHLRSVEATSETRSRWTAKGPGALPDLTWDAEVVDDVPGERIVWQSLPGADVDNAGHVRFADGPDGLTEIHARIAYRAPAGALGAAVARWLDPVLGSAVRQDIARFKHVIEAGEVPRNDPRVSGS